MSRLRIVLDTNVLISGIAWKGKPQRLLNEIEKGKIELIISSEILEELLEVLEREKKLGITKTELSKIKRLLLRISTLVEPEEKIKVITDSRDNKIIECAVGNADYIVSGDKEILALKEFKGIKIISPAKMLEIILSF